jgi:drug/metabolite transporter (DMT)-like permease
VKPQDFAGLLVLAVAWSLQFLFMRVAVPEFGPWVVADSRALFAAVVLVPAAFILGQPIALRYWRDYVAIGLANNVLPFSLFALAALALPTGYMAIINGTVPLWTALFAAWMLGDRLRARNIVGFAIGLTGVSLIVNLGPAALNLQTVLATLAGLLGAAFWGYAGVLIKQRTAKQPPIGSAAGCVIVAAVALSPAWADAPPLPWSVQGTVSLLLTGALCTGVAYFVFFRLVRDIGPFRTLSVGFMVPVLGVFWGWLFLGEPVTFSMVAGGALVLLAMALVLRTAR